MLPSEIHNRHILFSALNWGMGHVSRSLSLLQQFVKNGNQVFIACDSTQRKVFELYLNNVVYIDHEGYPFEFKGKGRFGIDLLLGFPDLQMRMDKERRQVEQYVSDYKIDLVISDHRYGFRSSSVKSIFITHQTTLPVKWYHIGANILHARFIEKFNEVWIMDFEDHKLAGDLSVYKGEKPATYIGPYSRFSLYDDVMDKDLDTVIIASGPDIYAQQLIYELALIYPSAIVICNETIEVPQGMLKISADWKTQDSYIRRAKKIVSRSGYSTVMDTYILKSECEYYPTPGQAEQIYLKKKWG